MEGRTFRSMRGCLDGRMDGWMSECLDGGWLGNEQIGGWGDEWKEGRRMEASCLDE